MKSDMPTLRQLPTNRLEPHEIAAIRELMWVAFAEDEHGGFTEEDWQHSIGGMHFVLDLNGKIVSHASVVVRDIHVDDRSFRTGYVEAVATAPALQGRGYGTLVMRAVNGYVAANFELGALGTGSHGFYERLGWKTMQGPSFVRTEDGPKRTPDEDGYILVLRTPTTGELVLTARISCEWRPGDVW